MARQFDKQARLKILQTDASAIGLGAVLEQDGHVISRALSLDDTVITFSN